MLSPAFSGGMVVALAAVAVLAALPAVFPGGADQAPERSGELPWMSGSGAGHAYGQEGAAPFITTWRTNAANETITIPVGGSTGTFTVDWGDGTIEQDVAGDRTHRYGAAGTYTVSISGDFTRIHLASSAPPNTERLRSIDQWGDMRWTSMSGAFARAFDVVDRAADTPDLSGVRDMSRMFWLADLFNGDISSWDVSRVTDMSGMFHAAHAFNRDVSSWDVSGVTDMSGMFRSANSFNQDLSRWDVSGVTDMSGMFQGTERFNGDISSWDVSGVTDMHHMFSFAERFNGDISTWDVSQVRSVHFMFQSADRFNGDISTWDVSRVTDMSGMFWGADIFNGDISAWDVSRVTDMNGMFLGANSFNQDISGWDISQVRDMRDMFDGADSFEQNLGGWYIVLDDASIGVEEAPGAVGNIRAQNAYLDNQEPVYGIGSGGDSGSFEMDGSNLVLGVVPDKDSYTVTVTATGEFGTGNSRTLEVSVRQPPNSPPAVEAGADRTVPEGETATLNGVASDPDGDRLTYRWTSSRGDLSVSGSDTLSPSFTAPQVDQDTALTFTLTVTDQHNATASDQVTVTITDVPANDPPIADAGPDLTVGVQSTMTLAGAVSDPDGDELTYEWQQSPPAPVVAFDDRTSLTPTITVPSVDSTTTIMLILTVSDGTITVSDSLALTVEAAQDDTTAPVPVLSAPALTNGSSLAVAVDFGEPINATTFDVSDVAVSGGGTASGLAREGADAQRFVVTVGAPDSDGGVDVSVPAGGVADLAGNANAASNQVVVTFDRTAPVITVQGASPVAVYAGDAYEDPGAACTDGMDGELSGSVAVSSDVDADVPGTYSVIYTCMDGAGNSARAIRAVEVRERPAPTGADEMGWTVEELAGILGYKGEHRFDLVARCEEGTTLTGATVGLRLEGLLGQIGANPLGKPVSSYRIDIDVDASWLGHPGYWSLATIHTNTANSEISHAASDYGITLDEYMDAGPDAIFEYPDGNFTRSYLGGLNAYVASVAWSGEGSCGAEWVRD